MVGREHRCRGRSARRLGRGRAIRRGGVRRRRTRLTINGWAAAQDVMPHPLPPITRLTSSRGCSSFGRNGVRALDVLAPDDLRSPTHVDGRRCMPLGRGGLMSESATGSAPIPLSLADRAILAMEGPTIAGHTCKVIRVGTPAPSAAALAAAVAARLPLAPALTWTLAGPPDAACWRADPAVDLQAHIAQVACDSRPDDAALGREVARLFSQRLDRARPLWRIDVIGPLAGGDTVLVWKVHHALADGTTLMALARDVLFDPHLHGPAARSPPGRPGPAPPPRRGDPPRAVPGPAHLPVRRPYRPPARRRVRHHAVVEPARRRALSGRGDGQRRSGGRRSDAHRGRLSVPRRST